MRRYHKIVAICLILVLSLSVLSACKGGDENALFEGGGTGPIQNTETPGGEQQTPSGEQQTPNNQQQTPNNQQQTPNNEQQTPNNEQTPGGEQTPNNEQTPGNENKEPGNTETPEEDLSNGINNYSTVCMSFNLLLGDSTGTFSSLEQRGVWQVEIIKKYDPDLLGCQESRLSAAQNIRDNFPNYQWYSYTGPLGEGYNSMFWKKDRFELKDKGFEDYTNGGGFGISWVLLYDKKEQITTLFTNCHLTPGGTADTEEARQREGLFMMNNVWKKKCGKDVALYATGDYNTSLGSPTITVLSKGKFKSSADVTLNANMASGIDHVFINGDIQECVNFHTSLETFEPEGEEPSRKYWASDHKAVISYCNYSKRKK